MTEAEFIQANSRLEKYFDKEYTTYQHKEMYNVFKDWSLTRYVEAINYAIKNCKYLPKVADLYKINYEIPQVKDKPQIDFVKCNKCNGEGFVRYFRKIYGHDYEYMALCNCENGKKQKAINGYNIPTVDEIGI